MSFDLSLSTGFGLRQQLVERLRGEAPTIINTDLFEVAQAIQDEREFEQGIERDQAGTFEALEGTPAHAGPRSEAFLRQVQPQPPGLETARQLPLNVPRRL